MKKLNSSHFIDIYFEETKKLFYLNWKSTTELMTESDFKSEMLLYASFFYLHPKAVIHNMLEMLFIIVPELQVWTDNHINRKGILSGIERAAFVISTDIFANISLQQAMEEEHVRNIDIRYFDNETDAFEWIDMDLGS